MIQESNFKRLLHGDFHPKRMQKATNLYENQWNFSEYQTASKTSQMHWERPEMPYIAECKWKHHFST